MWVYKRPPTAPRPRLCAPPGPPAPPAPRPRLCAPPGPPAPRPRLSAPPGPPAPPTAPRVEGMGSQENYFWSWCDLVSYAAGQKQ